MRVDEMRVGKMRRHRVDVGRVHCMQAGRMCTFATLAVRAGGLRTLARPGQDILASGVRASVSLHPCSSVCVCVFMHAY